MDRQTDLSMGHRECGWHTQCHLTREKLFLSPSRHRLQMASLLLVGLCVRSPVSIPLLSACISSALTLCRSLRRSHRLCEVIYIAVLLYLKDAIKRDALYAWSSEPLLPISRVKTVSSADLFYFCHYTNNNFYRSIRLREMSSPSRNDCNLKHGYWPLP